jgi:methyl-accepting chemotaxis protein
MKLKFRLSIIVTAIMIVVVGGLSTLILTQASSTITELSVGSVERLASQRAAYWQGREEGYLRVAKVAPAFLGGYEQTEAERRRNRFDQFLEDVIESEPNIVHTTGFPPRWRLSTGRTAGTSPLPTRKYLSMTPKRPLKIWGIW